MNSSLRSFTRFFPRLLFLGLGLVPIAHAQTLYWDANGATAGAGATPTGTWGTDTFWNTSSAGTASTGAWISGATAVFSAGSDATGAFTVTVNDTQIIGGLTVATGTPTLSGGTLQLNGPRTFDITGSATIGSTITGAGTLTKTGAGALTLSGAADNVNLTATVNAGTLVLAKDSSSSVHALGGAGTVLTVASGATAQLAGTGGDQIYTDGSVAVNPGGTLDLNGRSEGFNNLTGAGTVTNSATTTSTLTLGENNGTATFAGVLQDGVGALALTKTGSGTLTLSGANTYTGGTTVSEGTLALDASNRLADSGAVTINGGTLALGAFNEAVGAVTLNAGSITGSGTLTGTSFAASAGSISASLAGNAALTKSGAGTLTLTGANTYTGDTTISAGTLQIGTGGTSGSLAGDIANNAALTFNRSDDLAYGGNISGTGSLAKQGAGTLTLSGANTFTGGILVDGGTLRLDTTAQSAVLHAATPLTFTSVTPVTLQLLSTSTTAARTTTLNGLTLSSGAATIDVNRAGTQDLTLDLRGPAGTAGITRAPGSTVDFLASSGALGTNALIKTHQANTASGILGAWATVNGGADWAANNGSDVIVAYTGYAAPGGTGSAPTIASGATANIRIDSSSTGNVKLAATGTTDLNTLAVTDPDPRTLDVRMGTTAATLRFGAVGGILTSGSAHTIGVSGAAGTLTAGGAPDTAGELIVNNGSALTIHSGIANNGAGAVSLTKTGSGTLTLTAANTYTGGTTINGGTLQIGDGGTTGSVSGNITNHGVLAFNRNTDFYYDGVISGTGALTMLGGTRLILAGANTYTGATTINAGTLELSGGAALADTTAVTLANTAGARLNIYNRETIGSLAGGGTTGGVVTLFAFVTLTTGGDNTSTIFAGHIADGQPSIFGGSLTKIGSGTLTLTGPNSYTGDTTIYAGTLQIGAGGTTGSLAVNGLIENHAVLAFNRSNDYERAGVIYGTGALIKLGGGTLTLHGNNTYTGGTTVEAGTLQIGNSGANLADTGAVIVNGGIFRLGAANETIGSLSGTGGVINLLNGSGRTLTVNQSADGTYAGSIQGTGGALVKQGGGTLTLSGDNTYTGATTVSGGTLQIGVGGTSGSLAGNVINNASLAFNRSNAIGFSGAISGSGSLLQSGSGTLTLTGANDYTGATTINGGTLALGSSGAIGSAGHLTFTGGTLQFGPSNTADYSSRIANSTGAIAINTNGQAVTFASALASTNTGGLTKTGAGTLTLTGANTYTGTTTLSQGTLVLGHNSALGTGTLAFGNGTIQGDGAARTLANALTIAGNPTFAGSSDLTFTGNFALGATARTLTVSNTGNTTFSGILSGTAAITKSGAGTLTLSGANTYTGATTIADGTLSVTSLNRVSGGSASSSLGAPTTVANGTITLGSTTTTGTLLYTGAGETTDRVIAMQGNGTSGVIDSSGSGPLIFTSSMTVATTPKFLTLQGSSDGNVISGVIGSGSSLALTKAGTGTWILAGNNGYSTTTLSGGTLQIGNGGTSGTLGTGAVTNHAALVFNRSNTLTAANAISGSGSVTQDGSGTLILTGSNSYAGVTTISSGTLQVGNGASGTLGTGAVTNDAALVFNRSGALSVNNAISGPGTVTKTGAGNTTLGGANTYTGATTINSGTLTLAGGAALADTTAVTLANTAGATLALTASETIGSLAGGGTTGGNVALGANTLTTGANDTSTTFAGIISGTGGSLTKTGDGTFTLTGANTFTGATTINGGTLALSGGAALADTTAVILANTAGATLALNASETIGSLAGGGATGGNVTLGAHTLTTGGDNSSTTFSGTLNGGTLAKTGAGTLTLSGTGDNNALVATVNAGTLVLAKDSPGVRAIGTAGTGLTINSGGTAQFAGTGGDQIFMAASVAVNTGGTLDLNGRSESFNGLTGGGTVTNTAAATTSTLTLGQNHGTFQFDGLVQDGDGTTALTKTGDGTFTLTGANTYTGPTLVAQGALVLGGSASLWGGTASVSSGATLTLAPTSGGYDFSTPLSYITLQGAGTVRITGTGSAWLGLATPIQTGFTGTLDVQDAGRVVPWTGGLTLTNATLNVDGQFSVGNYPTSVGALTGAGHIFQGWDGTTQTLTVGATSQDTTFSGVIHGDDSSATRGDLERGVLALTKTGTGTLTLTGANTYSGATTINAGTLQIGAGGANGTLGSAAVVNNSALVFNRNNAYSVANAISGSGTLTQSGSGTLTLTGDNPYTGATVISGGTLALGSSGAIGSAGNLTFTGGTLQFGASNTADYSSRIANSTGAIAIDTNGQAVTFASALASTNTGGLTKTGTGTLTLTGANTFTGATTINGGTLALSGGAALADTTAVTLANTAGATLLLNASETIGSLAGGGTTGGNVTLGAHTLTTGAADTSTTFAGIISGAGGSLTKTGTGTFTLSRANTYTGATTVSAGTLALTGAGRLSDTTALSVASGATFNLNGITNTIGSLAGAGTVMFGSGTLTTGGDNTSTTFAGAISGTGGSLTKTGTGTLTLTGANTYSGATTITNGTLSVTSLNRVSGGSASSSLGAPTTAANGTITLGSTTTTGTLLYTGAGETTDRVIALSGSGTSGVIDSSGSGPLVFTSNFSVATTPKFLTLQGSSDGNVISGVIGSGSALSLTKAGTGTWILAGDNGYATTTLSGGTLQIGNGGASGTLGTGAVTNNAALVFNRNNTLTAANAISGTGSVTQAGSGTLILTGSNSYAGATIIISGTLQVGSGGASGTLGTGAVTNDAALVFNRSGALSVNNAISGPGTVTQSGSGNTTLGGANTFTGATTINSGTLTLAGGAALADTNAVTLANTAGATLALTASETIGSLAGGGTTGGNVALGANTLTTGANDTSTTFAGIISGTGGSLTKTGDGTFTLSGANTYTGATTINGGTLALSGGAALADTTAVILANTAGATLALSDSETIGSLAGGGATGGNVTLGAHTLTTGGNDTSTTFAGVLSGTGGALTKTGTGTFTLSGANTYTGATTINGGTLALSGGAALADTTAVTLANTAGVTLALFDSETIGSLAGGGATGGNVILGATTLTTGANDSSTTYSGIISGTGGLTKTGAGTFTLTGDQAYTGGTTISAGMLSIGDNDTPGTLTGDVAIAADATLRFNKGNNSTYSGNLSGDGRLVLSLAGGGDAITLTGTNTHTGGTEFRGLLSVGSDANLGAPSGALLTSGTLARLQLTGAFDSARDFHTTLDGTGIDTNGFDSTWSGVFSGTGGLAKFGAGTLTLTGDNTYTAFVNGTALQAGTLAVSADANLGAASTKLYFLGGTLQTTESFTTNRRIEIGPANTVNYLISPGVGGGTFQTDAGTTLTVAGDITNFNTGALLTKTGAGTLVLTGSSTSVLQLHIDEGTLQVGNGGTTGFLEGNITNNATLALGGGGTLFGVIQGTGDIVKVGAGQATLSAGNIANNVTISDGTLLLTGIMNQNFDVTNHANFTINGSLGFMWGNVTNHGVVTLDLASPSSFGIPVLGVITGPGSLTKTGAGEAVLLGDQAYTGGTTISAGTLSIGDNNTPGTLTGDVAIAADATLKFNKGNNSTYSGNLSGDGRLFLSLAGGGDAITLTGTNTHTGGTEFRGLLSVGSDANLGAPSGALLTSGTNARLQLTGAFDSARDFHTTLDGTGIDTNGFDSTWSGVFSGTGGLAKFGAGTLTLTGDNTYTAFVNGTALQGGTLAVSADANLGAASTKLYFLGGTLQTTESFTTNRRIEIGPANTVNYLISPGVGGGTFQTDAGTTLTVTGNITNFNTGALLTKTGAGTLVLTGNSTSVLNLHIDEGTLQVGNGGTTGFLEGNITNNATLALGGGGTLFGVIQGTGDIVKVGAGQATLSAGNIANNVTINDGTLLLTGVMNQNFDVTNHANFTINGSLGFMWGNVTNHGVVTLDLASPSSFGIPVRGVITGPGSLTKTGAGEAVLLGDQAYTGGTTISAGTLSIGDNNTPGTLTGDVAIAADATLKFNKGNNSTYSGNLSGDGRLFLSLAGGGDAITLTGTNTHTGGTEFRGLLSVGSDANLGAPSGALLTSGTNARLQLTGAFDSARDFHTTLDGTGIDTNGFDSTWSGVFSGTGGLAKFGAGTLTLTGDNTYTAFVNGTALQGGTLAVSADANLGAASTKLYFLGGTLQTTESFTTNRRIEIGPANTVNYLISPGVGGGTFQTDAGTTLTVTGNITNFNTGALLTKTGAGTLVLTGNSTSVLNLHIDEGTLQVGNGGTTGFLEGNITNNATLALGGGGTLFGVIQGTGDIVKVGAGQATLSAGNIANNVTINDGTLLLTGVMNQNFDVTNHANFTINGSLGFMWGNVTNHGVVTLDLASPSSFGIPVRGVITGPGSLTKTGAGEAVLLGDQAYTGGTTISAGTLSIGDNNTPGTLTGDVAIAADATLKFNKGNNSTYSGNLSGDGRLLLSLAGGSDALTLTGANTHTGGTTIGGGTLQVGAGGATGTLGSGAVTNDGALVFNRSDALAVANAISGTGTLTQAGTGTLTLTGDNTYAGATTVAAGTLQFARTASLYNADTADWTAANLVVNSGATAAFNVGGAGEFTAANLDTLRANNVFAPGTFLGLDTTNAGGEFAYNSSVSGGLGLVKLGAGTLLLGGVNDYSGDTFVNAGTLKLGLAAALSPNTTLHVASGATFDANGFTQTFSGLSGEGDLDTGAGLTVNSTTTTTFAGSLSGDGGLSVSGAGTLVLSASSANTYTGATHVSGGTLIVNGSIASSSPTTVTAGGTLVIGATGAVTSTTAAVTGGSLIVNGTFTSTDAPITVSAGGLIGGAGTVGALAIASGGILAPGNSPGTLTVDGNATWAADGHYDWEINDADDTLTPGANWDFLNVTGTLSITATAENPFTLSLLTLTPGNESGPLFNFNFGQSYSYTIAMAGGGILGFYASAFIIDTTGFANPLDGGAWSLQHSGNDLNLVFTSAIPEPGTYAALLGALALLPALRRRQRQGTLSKSVAPA